jgi:hypothetical protein
MLISILQKKMESEVIESHNARKQIWLIASGALFALKNNPGLFNGLITYPNYPPYFEKLINLDIERTIRSKDPKEIKPLANVLIGFSRRNPYIGYCQGLNFVAHFLLTMQFTEEEAFWILSQIMETVIPMDYFTNMVGVLCDQ